MSRLYIARCTVMARVLKQPTRRTCSPGTPNAPGPPRDPAFWSSPLVPQSLSTVRPLARPLRPGRAGGAGRGRPPGSSRAEKAGSSSYLGANTGPPSAAPRARRGRGCGPPRPRPFLRPDPCSSARCRARPGAGPCAPFCGPATGRCCPWPPSYGACGPRATGLCGAGTRRPSARWWLSAWCACPGTRSRPLPPRPSARWAVPGEPGRGRRGDSGGGEGGRPRVPSDSRIVSRRCPA